MSAYLVRQYRPGYFSGFDNAIFTAKDREDILNAPWLENFKHSTFERFEVEDYGNGELIISAKFGPRAERPTRKVESWVAAFALPTDSNATAPDGGLMRDNWRYKTHES